MGKGDKKSKRGKIILGSFGVRRRKKTKKGSFKPSPASVEKAGGVAAPEAAVEVKAARPARSTKPKTAAKPAAKKSDKETDGSAEKTARTTSKAKKPAAEK